MNDIARVFAFTCPAQHVPLGRTFMYISNKGFCGRSELTWASKLNFEPISVSKGGKMMIQ